MSTFKAPTIPKKDLQFIRKHRVSYDQKAIRTRLMILWLTTELNSAVEIAKFANCSSRHVFNTIKVYGLHGIPGILQYDKTNRVSELEPYAELIKKDLSDKPQPTGKAIRKRIFELTGIKKSINQCINFIKSMGAKCMKPTRVPMGQNETDLKEKTEKQKVFVKNTLTKHIRAHRNGKCVTLFMDASHMQIACMICFIWCFTKPYLPSLNVRGRVSVIGAVSEYGEHFAYTITQGKVNQEAISEFFYTLRKKFKDKEIRLVLDNASYHHAVSVKELADELDIKLIHLPVASPNLNIIERLWKFIKSKFLKNKIFTHLDELECNLSEALKTLKSKHKKDLKSLLTTNFQYFDDTAQFVIV